MLRSIMEELIYRPHAVERMLVRLITNDIVRDIIESPDGIIKQSFDKEILYKKIRLRKDNLIALVVLSRKEILTVMNFFEVKK